MDALTHLESRVASLERSLRRARATAASFGLALLVVVAGAFLPQAQEMLRTRGIVLTNELDVDMVVLIADADGSLVVQTPGGTEIVRLGGPPARRIGH